MPRYKMIVIYKNNTILMKKLTYEQFEKWYAENFPKIKEVKLEKIN